MKDFTTGSTPKLMISFLLPLLMSNMLQAAYMIIDAVWAGKLLGPSGIAVVANGMPIIFLLSSLFAGIVIGASILAGHAFGSKNRAVLSDIISTSAIGTAALSLLISIPGVIFCGPILRLINTPAPLFEGARQFLSLIIGAMVLSSMLQWFASMMNAAGDSRTPFKILIISLSINVVLAPVLITGARILPPLGIAGLALSTIAANAVAACIAFFSWKKHHLSEIAPFRFQVHWKTFRRITAVGFPLALQMIVVSSSFMFILSLANRFGPDVTAAFGIGSRVDQISFRAAFAVTAAIAAMTAQNIGAGKPERVAEIMRWGLIFSLGFSIFFGAIVVLFPDTVTSFFTHDAAVTVYTRHYFRIVGINYIALGFLFAYQGVLRGAGDTLPSFIIISLTMVVLRVPLCYYLSTHTFLRESGLWMGITVSSVFGAIAFYFYYASGRWKTRGTRAHAVKNIATHAYEAETFSHEV